MVVPLAIKAQEAGDWPKVASLLEELLRHEPPFVRRVGLKEPLRPPPRADKQLLLLVNLFANWHGKYSEALGHLKRPAEAQIEQRRALELQQAAREAQEARESP